MSRDLAMMTATELLHGYAAKTISPVEATRAALDRIQRHNGRLNAFVRVDEDGALAAAKASEARWMKGEPAGRVDGVPTSIKDLALVKGMPTLRGSRTVDPKGPWTEDAPFVARLREEGAVLLGKTATPEFGWKGITDSPLSGVTRNPWNLARTPGGSSGGAAAACAAGMGALHQGSDGGGSIRIPSGFTGIYGIKPTFGRVPAYPASPFGTLSHIGPMTRSVADSALMLSVMSRPDVRDWYALPYDGTDWRSAIGGSVAGWRIAYSPDFGFAKVDPEVAAMARRAAESFAALGARVEEVELDLSAAPEIFRAHWYTGAANVYRALSDAQRATLDPGFVEVCREGLELTLPQYQDAVRGREALGLTLNRLLDGYDLLMSPTLPTTAFEAGIEVPAGSGMKRWPEWTPFSYPINLSRQPAATIPCGLAADGLPVGLHIVGPLNREDKVLTASRAYEAAHPLRFPDLG